MDTTFNGVGYAVVLPSGLSRTAGYAIALQADGKIVAAGYSSGVDGWSDVFVTRLNPNGTLDSSFGGGQGYVTLDIDGTATPTGEYAYGIAIQGDGRILAAGWTTNVTARNDNVLVARFNQDGSRDATFAANGFRLGTKSDGVLLHGTSIALQMDGTIIVGGHDQVLSGPANPHPMLMRFYGGNASAVATTTASSASNATATDAALMLLVNEDLAATRKK